MITSTILQDKYLDFEEYANTIPLYMQNSYGVLDQLKIYFDLLKFETPNTTQIFGVEDSCNNLANLFDIFDDKYDEFASSLPIGSGSLFVEQLGQLFGVYRFENVNYTYNLTTVDKTIELSDQEMLLMIKSVILAKNIDCSYVSLKDYYKQLGLTVTITTSNTSLNAVFELLTENSSHERLATVNIKHLFRAGKLYPNLLSISTYFETMKYNSGGTGFVVDMEGIS